MQEYEQKKPSQRSIFKPVLVYVSGPLAGFFYTPPSINRVPRSGLAWELHNLALSCPLQDFTARAFLRTSSNKFMTHYIP